MTTIGDTTTDGLALLLGPRQADVMRLLWSRGPATVKVLHEQLHAAYGLAYTTVMTLCVQLYEKGLLDRYRKEPAGLQGRGYAYVYAPRISEDDFVRAAVERQLDALLTHYSALVHAHVARHARPAPSADRAAIESLLAYLGTLRDVEGRPVDNAALDAIAALLERAEAAEREFAAWQFQARCAEQCASATQQHASATERRPPRPKPRTTRRRSALHVIEHQDPAGVCRVCGQPAPPARASRKDGLRVCGQIVCRAEARRRDNALKQQRARLRRRASDGLPVTPAG